MPEIAGALLLAMCTGNIGSERQACQAIIKATVIANKQYLAPIYDIDREITKAVPLWVKNTATVIDAYERKSIYIPLYEKEF